MSESNPKHEIIDIVGNINNNKNFYRQLSSGLQIACDELRDEKTKLVKELEHNKNMLKRCQKLVRDDSIKLVMIRAELAEHGVISQKWFIEVVMGEKYHDE